MKEDESEGAGERGSQYARRSLASYSRIAGEIIDIDISGNRDNKSKKIYLWRTLQFVEEENEEYRSIRSFFFKRKRLG